MDLGVDDTNQQAQNMVNGWVMAVLRFSDSPFSDLLVIKRAAIGSQYV